jgi:3-dehydroquinate dehydratase II
VSAKKTVRVINGANLNMLGMREPEIYGSTKLTDIAERCIRVGAELGLDVEFLQSNYEGEVVEWIQTAIGACDAIVINAGAFTHTSIAVHDALRIYRGRKIELHISNPHLREKFRHTSYVSPAVDAVVAGLGVGGYELTIRLLADMFAAESPASG